MSVRRQKPARTKPLSVTQEVIGPTPGPERIDPKWRVHFKRLLELREQLLSQQQHQFADAVAEQPGFSMHMADAGTDSYDRDLALSLLSHEQDAMYEVEEALNRIRDGTYGLCELTGKKIPAARLEAVPWARFTAEAEQKLEKKGRVERAQLGARETVRQVGPPPKS